MLSVRVLVIFSFLCSAPGILARPRDKGHKGLYDDVKIIPFVDEKIDDPDPGFGQNWNDLGNNDDHSLDKYNKVYDLYHKETDSYVNPDTAASTAGNDDRNDLVDVSSLPVEGGTEDFNLPKVDETGARKHETGARRHHRHGKSRTSRIHPQELKNIDDASEKTEKVPDSSKKSSDDFHEDEVTEDNVDLSKFLSENPDFKKNVGIITDEKVDLSNPKKADKSNLDIPSTQTNGDVASFQDVTKNQDSGSGEPVQKSYEKSSESKDYDDDEDFDDDDDDDAENEYDYEDEDEDDTDEDDDDEADEDEVDVNIEKDKDIPTTADSPDLSSEMYADAYDYYDGEQESSYSSSEMDKNTLFPDTKTPYDWFKEYDKMYSDQAASNVGNPTVENEDKKQVEIPHNEKVDPLTDKDHKTTTSTFFENIRKSINKDTDISDKTDKKKLINSDSTQEPSTSPNPPTAKKEWKSMVTQPANAEKKQKSDYVTYIESRPVEACDVDTDCHPGRYCKFGLCICGQSDFCAGHDKPVCGSDGTLYPSHCELHRTACVKGLHIKLASKWSCSSDKTTEVTNTAIDEDVTTTKHEKETSDIDHLLEDTQDTTGVDKLDKQENDASVGNTDNAQINDASVDKQGKINDVDKQGKINDVDNKIKINDVAGSILAVDAVEKTYNLYDDIIRESEDSNDDTYLEYESNDSKDYIGNDKKTGESDDSNEVDTNIQNEVLDQDKDETSDSSETDKILPTYRDDSDESLSPVNDHVLISNAESLSLGEKSDGKKPSLVPLFCTPDKYMEFKANVLQYHCLFFEEEHCDRQTQKDKHRLAEVMFNYFDHNYNGRIEKEELWEMQLRESMDKISTLCTLLDIVTFDELGTKDGVLSPDEFIQAFDIPDLLEHRLEVVPLLATVGNGLEVKCDVTSSHDVIWRRNGMDLALLNFPGISVLGDGSLYIESVGTTIIGNITCHDRNKPSVKQVHVLSVQKPPHVVVSPVMSEHFHQAAIELHCHAEGLPKPTVEWQFNDQTVEQGEKYYIHAYDNTLRVSEADYLQDSGVYKCVAHNQAGTAEAMATVTIHNPNNTVHDIFSSAEESFIVFHDDGYTMHEPSNCMTQRHVKPDFGNFYFIPDELDEAPSMCQPGVPCIWGSAVNVQERFVYVTQPRENRVLVIDLKDTLNPNQIIPTDNMPVSLYYIAHLDEVWVLCWNGEENGGAKTIVVIRDASKKTQHHTIHTQPIGNRFDLVQDIFLPPDNEIHYPYRYGYTVHNGQQGLFKLDLEEKKYLKAVDFTMFECVPKAMAFLPSGGHVLVKCVQGSSQDDNEILLQMDYITDIVISNRTVAGTPYVSPDSKNVVLLDEKTGQIKVFTVKEDGEISDEFDLTVGSPVNSATFHKASYNQGYDLYLTSVEAPVLFSVSLLNGKIDVIRDIGEPDTDFFLPWFKKTRPLMSGDVFSNFLSTTAASRMVIFNGRHHNIQCDYTNINNPSVLAYTRLTNI